MINYTLKYSTRKSISIQITKNAEVQVRAPHHVSKKEIDKLIMSKTDWITKHLAETNNSVNKKIEFTLNYGDNILLQGKEYPITEKNGTKVGFDNNSFFMPPNLTSKEIKYATIQIYKMTAKKILTNKVVTYAKSMNLSPTAVKVNSAKTRWGSCSGRNSINFSWRLVMAEDSIIDYVVVHELAHIKEHNHSSKFWAVVASIIPDYKERQEGLKVLQRRLSVEDWD